MTYYRKHHTNTAFSEIHFHTTYSYTFAILSENLIYFLPNLVENTELVMLDLSKHAESIIGTLSCAGNTN